MTGESTARRRTLYGVYGAGGYGREVIAQIADMDGFDPAQCEAVFVDDAPIEGPVDGHRVMSFDTFAGSDTSSKSIVLAIGNSNTREAVARRCEARGLEFFSTIARGAIVPDQARIGPGAIISPFVTITSNVRIGAHFHANLYSYVAHDCVIGDFVTFAPRVNCNGNIVIEDDAYIGTGAILRQGTLDTPLRIGRGAVVGMGAVVTKDVPAGATVVGNPARPMQPRQ